MKTSTPHALAAKAIRTELEKAFKGVKFKVTSRCFSGGNSVDIRWENGPATKEVDSLVAKYEYGSFDGMTDSYKFDNFRKDIPQVKYVQPQRTISEDIYEAAFKDLKASYIGFENLNSLDETSEHLFKSVTAWTARQFINRNIDKCNLMNGYNFDEMTGAKKI